MNNWKLTAEEYKILMSCELFDNLSTVEINQSLEHAAARLLVLNKDCYIFERGDQPSYMYILLSGSVTLNKIDINGKRSIINIFAEAATVFGEVYLYLEDKTYDYSCLTLETTRILALSKKFFDDLYDNQANYSKVIINNMLSILSHKAFYLNQKILILSSFTLRQKIAHYLLQTSKENDEIHLKLNRSSLADYIGTTRPSLSRELMSMMAAGLITVDKNIIIIQDQEAMEDLL